MKQLIKEEVTHTYGPLTQDLVTSKGAKKIKDVINEVGILKENR